MSGIVDKVKNALGGSKETQAGHEGIASNQPGVGATTPHPQHGHAPGTGKAEGGVVGKVKHALGADHSSQPTHGTTTSPGIAGAGTAPASPGYTSTGGTGVGVHSGASPHVGHAPGAGVTTQYVGQDPIRGPGAHGTGHTGHNHAIDPVIGAGGVGTGPGHHSQTVGNVPAVGGTTGHGVQTQGRHGPGGIVEKAKQAVGVGHKEHNPSDNTTKSPGIVEKAKQAVGVGHKEQNSVNTTKSPGLVDKAKHLIGADKGHQGSTPGSTAGLGHAGATGVNAPGGTAPGAHGTY